MTLTPEVEMAVTELREAFPDATVTAVADNQGGAYVTVDPIDLGSKYSPASTWIWFHITFQYPMSDVYPHFIGPDVRRSDGASPNGLPLGEGSSLGSYQIDGQTFPAIQLSRRSNGLNPACDTAALKLQKVLAWLQSL